MNSRAFALRNNSAHDILPETRPWLNTSPIPPFQTKELYRSWCSDPNTDHLFFSVVEGSTSTLRVGAGNDPFRVHGIIADYDVKDLTPQEIARGLARIPASLPFRAYNRTFSGGLRIVWIFENPIFYYSSDVFKKFIRRCVKELKLKEVLPGLDDHIEMPELYYACGAGWTVNESAMIRSTLLELWLYDACKVEKMPHGIEVPLHIVEAEVHRRYPNRWTGPFEDGSRGVRFWAQDGDAKSAIVRPTGMVAFTGNEPFLPWDRLFGREFVMKYLEDRRGKALAELYSDGSAYYRQLPTKQWQGMNTETARRHLRVVYGLTDRALRGENASEIDTVLNQIEQRKVVEGVMPFPLNPNDVVNWNGFSFLNTSRARILTPHPEPQGWGFSFPWIASYLSTLFYDEVNLDVFLAWLSIWLKSARDGDPCRGHSLFVVGPPSTGKSLLSRQIIARLVGGYADARDHLVDGGRFNSALFEKALWVIDDSTVLADRKAHDRFSALIKAAVANDSMTYERKFGYGGAIPFAGRIVVTANDDPTSLSILPNTETSLLDKSIFLRTGEEVVDWGDLKTQAERCAMLDRQLPAFMRWLLDWEIPDWIQPDQRFGMKSYHEPSLLAEAREAAPSATILQILEEYRTGKTARSDLELTSTQLYSNLAGRFPELMRTITLHSFSKQLNVCIENGCQWLRRTRVGKAGTRIVIITPKAS